MGIKRKHHFSGELNPRYMARLAVAEDRMASKRNPRFRPAEEVPETYTPKCWRSRMARRIDDPGALGSEPAREVIDNIQWGLRKQAGWPISFSRSGKP